VEGFPEHLMLFPFVWRGSQSTWCYSRSCGGVPGAHNVIPVIVEEFPEHLMLFPLLWMGSRNTWCYSRYCGGVPVSTTVLELDFWDHNVVFSLDLNPHH
jgi:hypothetical protein